jgi:hypothetical protein
MGNVFSVYSILQIMVPAFLEVVINLYVIYNYIISKLLDINTGTF